MRKKRKKEGEKKPRERETYEVRRAVKKLGSDVILKRRRRWGRVNEQKKE
jgi:hypothetical protein